MIDEKTLNFIEKSKKIHGDKYDYSETKYKNMRSNINLICKSHGVFSTHTESHLRLGRGCPKCARDKHKLTKISTKRLEKMKSIHNDKYKYQDLSINDGFIYIMCLDHGEFSQRIYAHEKGHGCSKCYLDSRSEEKLIKMDNKKRMCKSCKENLKKSDFSPKFKICKSCQENPIVPTHKTCIKCKNEKIISEFQSRKKSWDGYRNVCVLCFTGGKKIMNNIYKQKNKSIIREKDKIYRKNRMKSDLIYRIKIMSRNIIRKSLSKGGYTKRSRTYEILGCSYEDFKTHIENLFQNGMNWDNRYLWDIDHIVPISLAESEQEMVILNHYTNLRPLWKNENEYKSDRVTEEVKSSPIYKELMDGRRLSFSSIYFGSFKVIID